MTSDLEGQTLLNTQKRRFATIEEKFELIASGAVLALIPESVARSYSRPDLVAIEMADAPLVETCLVVQEGRREPRVLEFLEVAEAVLREQPAGLVAAD